MTPFFLSLSLSTGDRLLPDRVGAGALPVRGHRPGPDRLCRDEDVQVEGVRGAHSLPGRRGGNANKHMR